MGLHQRLPSQLDSNIGEDEVYSTEVLLKNKSFEKNHRSMTLLKASRAQSFAAKKRPMLKSRENLSHHEFNIRESTLQSLRATQKPGHQEGFDKTIYSNLTNDLTQNLNHVSGSAIQVLTRLDSKESRPGSRANHARAPTEGLPVKYMIPRVKAPLAGKEQALRPEFTDF